jgi:hypothetical protein
MEMKWYKPREAIQDFQSQSKMLATIAIFALGLSLVAIFIAIGKEYNATS